MDELESLMAGQGVATWAQLLEVLSRRTLQLMLRTGVLVKVWPGVYGLGERDLQMRLRGLDLRAGEPVVMCLSTAAAAFGFDTEDDTTVHVLNPMGHHLRNSAGLAVHRRDGAPLTTLNGRPTTTAAWTAIELSRALLRPRALACLDAALRSGTVDVPELVHAADAQHGRRGIVHVRELIPLARRKSESQMESEARLAMHDGGLPEPELQYEVVDRLGRVWRLDFAWPDVRIAVEYEGFDWHSTPEQLRHDREKRAALLDIDWVVLSITADDVRRQPSAMNDRIGQLLVRRAAA
ncbi:hypothetical protein AWB99_11800 [Mycolicibacterium confluentis]|uniref:Uncharacterized protein n=2 Tax=Mycolicibacterium confluentis TaxID=28047 RepID=A0A7I7XUF8_9MYCO|nr:hypothetical protein [Mycolicibacterium confluentis]MCV7322205.1 hypothetical protein [Mycolicibacterium confluentis]ORV31541.1 hypothetical protein AWB99_11800 [Mycolicibacterium confluentis]BBZ32899.1 hypothetical protein MCNF_15040 [Mycolicibacterium confluentis]